MKKRLENKLEEKTAPVDFIRQRIADDIEAKKIGGGVVTRFPPEPNGYLHIGHAKSICLNFGVAEEFGGTTFLRFDDTNPLKESDDYVNAIKEDVAWLGFDWGNNLTFASDYFPRLYGYACELIQKGHAYVCQLTPDEIRQNRGTLTESGTDSPYRDRSVAENLDLFERMRQGEFADGTRVLRAKIDMASPNMNMRDPVLYRVRHATHHRTGDDWVIYPMYDFTHCICDAMEAISHSLCTLEFADHRPLYDWVLDHIEVNIHPPQIEFSRLGLEYTVMSKRLLNQLVQDEHVSGWDDPRMPTLAGMRRRGVTPAAIREFCRLVGVTKQNNIIEMNLLEFCIRQDLESNAPRGMAVLKPLPITITNYDGASQELSAPWHAQNEALGERGLSFGPNLYIEQEDFSLDPPKKYKRLSPGDMVRLRYGFIIRCDKVVQDASGAVVKLECSYFPDSKSGSDTSGLKPKGVIHWVNADTAVAAKFCLYDRLLKVPTANAENILQSLNEHSLQQLDGYVEPAIESSDAERFQFERTGYFCKDTKDAGVFNRTVSLRDSWKPTR